jgi:hypothetical protein
MNHHRGLQSLLCFSYFLIIHLSDMVDAFTLFAAKILNQLHPEESYSHLASATRGPYANTNIMG